MVQVPGENGPYKPSSAGTGQVHNNFVGYPANVRYVSQPVYMSATTTASNVYRDAPFHSRVLNVSLNIGTFVIVYYVLYIFSNLKVILFLF